MAQFRTRFLDRAETDAQVAQTALAEGDFATLHSICHGLSGNAGMFGFADIGAHAQAVERAIDANDPASRVRDLAGALLDRLNALSQER